MCPIDIVGQLQVKYVTHISIVAGIEKVQLLQGHKIPVVPDHIGVVRTVD